MTQARDLADGKFDTDTLVVDAANNRVGVGTTTVDSALHIEQNASGVTETSGSTLKVHNTNASGRSKISVHNSAETASGSIYYDTDSGMLALQGDTGAGVVIQTSGNNERLRVDTSGNVGIGTSPSVALHVKAGSGQIRLHEGAAADNKYGEIEVSNGKLILHSDKANVENNSTMQFHLDNIEYARFKDNGQLLIGATSTASATKLHVTNNNYLMSCHNNGGTSGFFGQIQFLNNADNSTVGSIIRTNDASVSYNTTSDARLKENVADMTGGIAKVKQLAPKRFSWIAEDLNAADQDGFLAHEAQAVVPGCATGTQNEVDDDGNPVFMQMDAAKLVPVLTAALKESIAKIETLETEMTALKARITALEDA